MDDTKNISLKQELQKSAELAELKNSPKTSSKDDARASSAPLPELLKKKCNCDCTNCPKLNKGP